MSRITIATPLRVEARAVRRGAAGATVIRTGMGKPRSLAARSKLAGDQPLVVMGLAGGLAAGLVVGDIVVGDIVVGDAVIDSAVPDQEKATICPDAGDLAADLRALGHRVHVGPTVTVEKLVHGPSRAGLAATGALAVDMESAYLLADWPGRRVAVVRVVSDTAASPLLRPSVIPNGLRCLRTLRAITGAVERWADEGRRKEQSGASDSEG